jgi:hypothetical protein
MTRPSMSMKPLQVSTVRQTPAKGFASINKNVGGPSKQMVDNLISENGTSPSVAADMNDQLSSENGNFANASLSLQDYQ